MKHFLFLFTCCVSIMVNATTHTVSNAAYLPAQFSTVQTAIDNADAGDTILISSTMIPYGIANVGKQLYFFGPGGKAGIIPEVNFVLLNADASGCHFEGLGGSIGSQAGNLNTDINDVVIRRCRLHALWIESESVLATRNEAYNWLVEGCAFTSDFINIGSPWGYGQFFNWTVRNCVFSGTVGSLENSVIMNCLFLGNVGYEAVFEDFTNVVITDCMFVGMTYNSSGNELYNNLFVTDLPNCSSGVNACSGNFSSATTGFVLGDNNQFYSDDNDYHLTVGSPAIGAGYTGGDVGLYNNTIFRDDFEPSIPVVRSLVITNGPVVPAQGSFEIVIHSVSHD
ncbi:MAG: hypothetical protein K1X54_13045 [Flavobacteriales bacterium]|nr:hypothetical protein [Flavobacteriales bacterium]